MKKMQEFNEWLITQDEKSTAIQNRLGKLTRLSRIKLNSITEFSPWYIWQSDNSVA